MAGRQYTRTWPASQCDHDRMTSPFAPSSRSAVAPFEVMDVLATVARMRAEGREVISLCAGEPSQGAPGPVHETAAAILSLIHISEPTRRHHVSRMPSSA